MTEKLVEVEKAASKYIVRPNYDAWICKPPSSPVPPPALTHPEMGRPRYCYPVAAVGTLKSNMKPCDGSPPVPFQ